MSGNLNSPQKVVDILEQKLREADSRLNEVLQFLAAYRRKADEERKEVLRLSRQVRGIIDQATGKLPS